MRAAVLTVVLISLTLAGCIGGPVAESGEEQDWPTITDPKNLSYDTDGFHVHDYWGGEDVVTVLDDSYGGTSGAVGPGAGDARSVIYFRPSDGRVVPQGTARLEATVSWADVVPAGTMYGDLELWVKPANASEARLVEDDLENRGTVEVPVAYEEADLPHQLISAWEFQVHIRGSDDPYYRWYGTVDIHVEAHRGLELRPFPPHPDHWGNRTELGLVDVNRSFDRVQVPYQEFYFFDSEDPIRPANGSIVPLGADRVEVTLTYDRDLPGGDIHLYFHGADTREFARLEPYEAETDAVMETGVRRYTIPVTDAMADTPYAEASQWVFYVRVPRDATDGATMFAGDYTLNATVHKG